MSQRAFPPDVHPESGCRLPPPRREDMDPAARKIYDYYVDPKGGSLAGLWGPGGIKLHSPRVSEYTRDLGRYLRHEAGIAPPIRELAILVAAREMDSQFEWVAHEPHALEVGLPPGIIDVVKHRKALDSVPETEAAVIRFGRELFGRRRVAPETFARALRLFGERQLVDLVVLMANYTATASLLNAFDMQLRPGKEPLLPVE